MTKKEKFEVAAAAFEALLGRNSMWKQYMQRFYLCKHLGNSDTIYTTWKKWAKSTPVHKWVKCAFVWSDTPQGHEIWRDIDYDWLTWICDNLNK